MNTIESKISNNNLTGSYTQYDYGSLGISMSSKDSIIENNIIDKFDVGIWLNGYEPFGNNIDQNQHNIIDDNQLFKIIDNEGGKIKSQSTGTIIKNNFVYGFLEIGYTENDIFYNEDKYTYLTKIYDSKDQNFEYHVKIFQVN